MVRVLRNRIVPQFAQSVRNYSKSYWREALALLVLLISIYFLHKERHEMSLLLPHLQKANPHWLLIAGVVSMLYILLQSGIYVNSFLVIKSHISWKHSIELFLKRNLLAVFLPGGGVSALAYVPFNIKKAIGSKGTIHQASGIFAFAGMLSTLIVGLPVLFLNIGDFKSQAISGLAITTLLILLVLFLFINLKQKGWLYRLIQQKVPGLYHHVHGIINTGIDHQQFALAISSSVGVEICGIVHLYVAMLAIGAPASLPAAGIAYIVATLLMVVSPFLKGLGAVELSIAYVLSRFGYEPVHALSIVIIYRVFEFWLPLLAGLLAFIVKGSSIFFRIFPAVSIFLLGVINIISVITPPIAQRIHWIRVMIPGGAIQATNVLVLFAGFVLIITAAYLIKGMRNAWRLALVIAAISMAGHLVKAFDYEEALLAATVLIILLFTQKHYVVKSNPQLVRMGFQMAARERAAQLVEKYGRSALDYFKLTNEKHIYISMYYEGFISYAINGGFAVVLEEPVCKAEQKVLLLQEFEEHCRKAGLKTAFYRVDESSLGYFVQLKMKKMMIGQEAVLDVASFDLGGKNKKALRNALNSLQKNGYYSKICAPPHSAALLAQMRRVSDAWLHTYHQKELRFAQGTFDDKVIQTQDVIALFHEEKVVAFLNIIPDYAPNECTYDLIRKVRDAPGGCIDGLMVQLINYAIEKGLHYINLGLAPMSGIQEPENTAEQVMKYAYDRFRLFKQYQGARAFKEKYASTWMNKYLVYEHDFDLFLLPAALNRVMKTNQLRKT